jgi:tetrapyrrole methylase family protein/MazG family protein
MRSAISLDAETALQAATDKFVARFNRLEDELQARGKQLGGVDLAQLDAIWDAIKEKEPNIEHPRPNVEVL